MELQTVGDDTHMHAHTCTLPMEHAGKLLHSFQILMDFSLAEPPVRGRNWDPNARPDLGI